MPDLVLLQAPAQIFGVLTHILSGVRMYILQTLSDGDHNAGVGRPVVL